MKREVVFVTAIPLFPYIPTYKDNIVSYGHLDYKHTRVPPYPREVGKLLARRGREHHGMNHDEHGNGVKVTEK